MENLHHIVVVGGGAGGLELVTSLGNKLGKKGKARISLVDAGLTHVWKPLLHEVASGSLDASANEPLPLIDALVAETLGASASKSEARRLLKQNSVSLNGQKVQDENADVREHRTGAGAVVMSVGKAKRFLIRFNG